MVQKIMKFVFGTLAFVGFLIILGTAGADCDGKCMENAMTIGQTLAYFSMGIGATALGALFIMKG